jgi:hypothetical protein
MTYTDATVSDTGTYTFQVSCINYSNLEGDKSVNLTLSKGNVTAAIPMAQMSIPKSRRIGLAFGGNRALLDGPVALYDVRGRLLARSDLSTGGSLKALLGKNTNKIFVVQPITSTK